MTDAAAKAVEDGAAPAAKTAAAAARTAQEGDTKSPGEPPPSYSP